MVKGILADVNVEGHFHVLLSIFRSEYWRAFWTYLNLATPTFADLGLTPEISDWIVWQRCQQEQLILLTANRNARGEDSLEEVIRCLNTSVSLPVFTIARPEHLLHDQFYAERAATRIMDFLYDIDRLRGTGRLYIP